MLRNLTPSPTNPLSGIGLPSTVSTAVLIENAGVPMRRDEWFVDFFVTPARLVTFLDRVVVRNTCEGGCGRLHAPGRGFYGCGPPSATKLLRNFLSKVFGKVLDAY